MKKNALHTAYIQYCNYIKIVKLYSESTVNIYSSNIYNFLMFLQKNKKFNIKYIDKRIIEIYLQNFISNYSIQTVNLIIASLNSFFCFLNNQKKFPTFLFPKIKYFKNIRTNIKIISQKKLLTLFKIKDPKNIKNTSWIYYRNFAMVYLIYATGMRISEVLNLETNYLYRQQWIYIKNGKNEKTRVVPIVEKAVKYIDLYKQKCPYKFFSFLWFSNKGKKLNIGAAKIAIKGLFGFYPHYFRHAYATHLIENGCDIKVLQELLGHSSLATTQIYISVSDKMLIETMKKHPFSFLLQ